MQVANMMGSLSFEAKGRQDHLPQLLTLAAVNGPKLRALSVSSLPLTDGRYSSWDSTSVMNSISLLSRLTKLVLSGWSFCTTSSMEARQLTGLKSLQVTLPSQGSSFDDIQLCVWFLYQAWWTVG